jgi:hypothetical protein
MLPPHIMFAGAPPPAIGMHDHPVGRWVGVGMADMPAHAFPVANDCRFSGRRSGHESAGAKERQERGPIQVFHGSKPICCAPPTHRLRRGFSLRTKYCRQGAPGSYFRQRSRPPCAGPARDRRPMGSPVRQKCSGVLPCHSLVFPGPAGQCIQRTSVPKIPLRIPASGRLGMAARRQGVDGTAHTPGPTATLTV